MSDSTSELSQIMVALRQLQLENEALRNSLQELQVSTSLSSQPPNPSLPPQPSLEPDLLPTSSLASSHFFEPKVSLPEKFDGTRSRFRGFINQIRLIIRLQPQRYGDGLRQVGLVGTLLSGPAQAWFAPLVETSSPLLEDFPAFLAELEATFGETDRRRTALNKLYALEQGSRAASVYASEFRQLACDVNWDDQALVDHFRRGLRSNVKNLLLNFPEPTSLSQAISQAVHCDNRLFEFRQEERRTWVPPHSLPRHTPVVQPQVSLPPAASHSPTMADAPVPMEIDQARFRPLTDAERQFRRANGLCMYCGASGHVVRHCPRSNRPQFHRANGPQHPENDIVRLQ